MRQALAEALGGWSSHRPSGRPAPRGRTARWSIAAVPCVALFAVWLGIRTFPGFGPMLADSLRLVIGSENVTALEELSAGVEDSVRQRLGGTPRGLAETSALTSVTASSPRVNATASANPNGTPDLAEARRAFRPKDVGPMFASLKSAEDGLWQAVPVEGTDAADAPLIYRMILHPDAQRSYAELFVFALDVKRIELHAVAGTIEPKSKDAANGPGRIDVQEFSKLIAAFNGGFKAEHGHFGMMANGVEYLAPKPTSCTVAGLADGTLRVGTWAKLEADATHFVWWRQTPACMVEARELHAGLKTDASRSWGATLEGDTVIRRSAIGLDATGTTLFVAISNSTTARALATGMQHAGAHDVAQLDVNHSFPKFLLYRSDAEVGSPKAMGAVKGFLFDEDDYVGEASSRDFFYVTRR